MVLDKGDSKVQIPIQIEKADKFVSRLKGLMFRKELPEDVGLLLVPCNSIHMFFMRFPIDIIFLSQSNRIVKLVENVQPWSVIPLTRNAYSTLELAAGTIKRYGFQKGDRIRFE